MDKVLIVDDSLVQAAQLKSMIDQELEVTIVHTAVEGLREAGTGEYSLILLDLILPDMDGFTMLKELQEREAARHVPVIIITSLSAIEHEQRGLALGAVDYVLKPFHPTLIRARVNTHIKLYQYRRLAEEQSVTDWLTGVANRRRHDQGSISMWQEAVRLRLPISVCMMDIDKFKVYNDSFGHPAGDKVITAVAKAAESYLRRETDFFARYGGEEFVAIMLGEETEVAFEHMKIIRQAVEDLHIPQSPEVSPWVTVSIGGITLVPQTESRYETILKIADTMLYDAKRFGRNQVVWTDGGLNQLREK